MWNWLRGKQSEGQDAGDFDSDIEALTAEPDPVAPPVLTAESVFAHGSIMLGENYVSRPDLEARVLRDLQDENKMIYFSGPTKSGKSVLINKMSDQTNMVVIDANKDLTSAEFWDQLQLALKIPFQIETASETQHKTAASPSVLGEIGTRGGVAQMVGIEGKFAVRLTGKTPAAHRETQRAVQENRGRAGVINYLKEVPYTVVIDDFHWLDPEHYNGILSPFKGLMGRGSRLVLISVRETPPDVTGELSDIAGRMVNLPMPRWEREELDEIGNTGFMRLNYMPDGKLIRYLSIHSYGNPMLMQAICREYCRFHGIHQPAATPTPMPVMQHDDIGGLVTSYAKEVTRHFDPLIEANQEGPWMTREACSRGLSMRWVFLLSISHLSVFDPISIDAMADRLRNRVLAPGSDYSTLNALLVTQARTLQTKLADDMGGRAPFFYDEKAKTVAIVDPYFKQWLRWVRSGDLAGAIFDKT